MHDNKSNNMATSTLWINIFNLQARNVLWAEKSTQWYGRYQKGARDKYID